jgi:hypothetical protein
MRVQTPEELFTDIEVEPRSGSVAQGVRRAMLALFALFVLAALLDVFGQQPQASSAGGRTARLTLSAPRTVRGGLLIQARVRIQARRTIDEPHLILDRGWFEGMQVNTVAPEPTQESGYGRKVLLAYDRLDAGKTLTVWIALQVDPTFVGKRSARVRLQDSTTPLATITRSLTILP